MTDELLPCPFCGRKYGKHEGYCYIYMLASQERFYAVNHGKLFSEDELQESWNTRYKRTCKNVYVEKVHPMNQCVNGFMCSECGNIVEDDDHYAISGVFDYCPACGCEVVDDA